MENLNKGKCYSQIDRGQRERNDFYQTPYSMTEALLKREHFDRGYEILEPACGNGAIIKILKSYGFDKLLFYDKNIGKMKGDFLTEECRNVQYIITNPPFSKANEFILKAKQICTRKFAFLMKLNYLQGQFRYDNIYNSFDYFPLTKIYIFTRMPTLKDSVREDGKYETGMQAMAWYIWCRSEESVRSNPRVFWIDSLEHVARKNGKTKN